MVCEGRCACRRDPLCVEGVLCIGFLREASGGPLETSQDSHLEEGLTEWVVLV